MLSVESVFVCVRVVSKSRVSGLAHQSQKKSLEDMHLRAFQVIVGNIPYDEAG